jgi:hypothetical protein
MAQQTNKAVIPPRQEYQTHTPITKAPARYRLLDKAYIDDVLYDPETTRIDPETGDRVPLYIEFDGVPGWHMEPVNDAAREAKAKAPHSERDPLSNVLIMNGPGIGGV